MDRQRPVPGPSVIDAFYRRIGVGLVERRLPETLTVDLAAARVYGMVSFHVRKAGRNPRGRVADMFIAAACTCGRSSDETETDRWAATSSWRTTCGIRRPGRQWRVLRLPRGEADRTCPGHLRRRAAGDA